MYHSIMVPLDGSALGEHALPMALALARRSGAGLHLVHVHSPLSAVYLEGAGFLDESLDTHMMKQQQVYLDDVVRRLEQVSSVPVTSVILEGAIATTLADHAVQHGADLVVMTTHGRGVMGRFWLGSVADELVRLLPMPLLLARPHETPADLAVEPPLRHLLLSLDGTSLAEQMIDPTIEFAALTGAAVTILRCVAPVMPVGYGVEGLSIERTARTILDRIETLQGQVRREAEEYLERVAQRFQAKGVVVRTATAVEHQAAVAILREAAAAKCDLIALETHGRHGLARLILGSVADKVIRGATIPVLVHRPLS